MSSKRVGGVNKRRIAACPNFWDAANRGDEESLPVACRALLQRLAIVRRRHRDTVTPEQSDALDTAADALSRILEGFDDE